ncbi:manno(fructo)kinase [Magnetospirillum sp. LM-5]|uniref:ROK family protein n=1 Tax=Magnetospirillum sp. LM-5 TaxID=2681466 RepID=UPI001385B4E5|nr:ROK family protein [Magnetospirillum sp. LM-5]CAA7623994.1 manno(fructo)kinase [Magnetospirillum sp. LM-5]
MTDAMKTLRIGIDLGGTKTEAIALDRATGAELARRRVATAQGSYDGTITTIRDLVAGLESDLGAAGTVGIGIPGTISPATGLVKNANSTWLIGQPFDRDLESALGRPVRLANDADCFALSEATDGAGTGADTVFGVILGTGVGGGLVVHGRLVAGPNAVAGEWGHNPLPWPRDDERPGPACYCGKTGCVETFLSGPGLERDHGQNLRVPEIAVLADAGDPGAAAALARYEDRLARALAVVINILDPHVIVLGGGVGNLTRLYSSVPARWGAYVFSDSVATRLVPPRHGDSSGVRGAAWLYPA